MYVHIYIHTYLNVKTAKIYYSNFLYFVNVSNNNSIQFSSTLVYLHAAASTAQIPIVKSSTETTFINF